MSPSDIPHLENQLDLMRKLDEVARIASTVRPRLELEMVAARRAETITRNTRAVRTRRGVSVRNKRR